MTLSFPANLCFTAVIGKGDNTSTGGRKSIAMLIACLIPCHTSYSSPRSLFPHLQRSYNSKYPPAEPQSKNSNKTHHLWVSPRPDPRVFQRPKLVQSPSRPGDLVAAVATAAATAITRRHTRSSKTLLLLLIATLRLVSQNSAAEVFFLFWPRLQMVS